MNPLLHGQRRIPYEVAGIERSLRLSLPYPPSANRYWRVVRGRPVTSLEARQYREIVRLEALRQLGSPLRPLTGDVSVIVTVMRPAKRGDLDNTLKVLLDALQGVAYHDDKQVADLHATRHDKYSYQPGVIVTVQRCEQET